jgi:NADPH-dependent glutamate synthase beta subunit-like oxidoreductase
MDCGIPFCHKGCPLGNIIPDWNDLVYRGPLAEAIERLHATNNFPEFTGRLCPAPCEAACVLGINEDPVTIKQVEVEIVDRAWAEGWIGPLAPRSTGKTVAVVGSGPAGLAAAQQLPRRPRRHGLRARRPHRRPAALRHPRVQDGEAPPRPPHRADGGRGRSNALREGARDVLMLDVYPPLPPSGRPPMSPWPLPPKRTPTTYALDEGGERRFGCEVTEILGEDGHVVAVRGRRVEGTSSRNLRPIPGSEFTEPADLVLIAIGFAHPEHDGPVRELGLDLDARGNVRAPVYGTSVDGVFACGDARIGQSLVVTAIAEGRRCARVVDRYLGGTGELRRLPAEALFAYEDGDINSLRHQAEVAGTVTVGEDFWVGPRERR